MEDAARLASSTGDGILWHPSSLADIHDTPHRTLLLFDFYRAGLGARMQPWTWWRAKGKRTSSHQYVTDWTGQPERPARCGAEVKGDLEIYDVGHCSKCERLDRGENTEPTGTVAGVRVGANALRSTSRRRREGDEEAEWPLGD